ncbi:TPA: hypothetical protein HA235_07665 [Candidatus Woesearchaeota archaeon]|nr:hypothetical protein [Candidatus Woesearchaeota archaeon]HIH32556.1 hypothetical protein [Candidatus Woesearchaeota archaeon]HIH54757.1 hypothetical protein [Candidatus Woesearchaeota archaeon]HIJ13946.1 hypothetical protein [Candidatus Woesearchaeota archaeon]
MKRFLLPLIISSALTAQTIDKLGNEVYPNKIFRKNSIEKIADQIGISGDLAFVLRTYLGVLDDFKQIEYFTNRYTNVVLMNNGYGKVSIDINNFKNFSRFNDYVITVRYRISVENVKGLLK